MRHLKILFFLLTLGAGLPAAAQTLHAVLVADTLNAHADFAKVCRIDFKNMRKEVADMAKGAGFQLKEVPVAGRDFTAEKLRAAVASIQASEKDVCLLYYSGLGLCNASDTRNRVLRLGTNNQDTLSTGGIVSALERKNARLNVVIVDACAKIRQVPLKGPDRGDAEHRVYQSLLAACGTLRMFSSQCAEYSYCDTTHGSVFTKALLGSLDHFIGIGTQSLSWEALFNETRNTVKRMMGDIFLVQTPGWVDGTRVGCEP